MLDSSSRSSESTCLKHQRVRKQHSDELTQDYLEAIFNIQKSSSKVRIIDLQKVFGVSHVTIIRALKRMEQKGVLVRSEKEGITLTKIGTNIARISQKRHQVIVDFLIKLGVSADQADADAEGIEHHLSTETLGAFQNFLTLQTGNI